MILNWAQNRIVRTGDTRPTSCRITARFCRLLPIYVCTQLQLSQRKLIAVTKYVSHIAQHNLFKPVSIFCKESLKVCVVELLSKLEYLHTCEFGLYNHFKIFVKTSFYNLPTRVHLQFVLDTQGTFFGLRLYPARVLCLGQKGYNHRLTVPYRVPLSPSL